MFKKSSRDKLKNDHDNLNFLIDSYQSIIEQYINNQPSEFRIYNFIGKTHQAKSNCPNIIIRFIRNTFRWSSRVSIGVFTCIGLLFTSVYFGMRLGVFNVQGSISQRDSFYGKLTKIVPPTSATAIDISNITTTTSTLNCISQSVIARG